MKNSTINRCKEIAREFGVRKLVLFGSALDSPETANDLDIACEGLEGWDLFRFGARLEEEVGASVDVIPLESNDRFARYVARRGRILYDAE